MVTQLNEKEVGKKGHGERDEEEEVPFGELVEFFCTRLNKSIKYTTHERDVSKGYL